MRSAHVDSTGRARRGHAASIERDDARVVSDGAIVACPDALGRPNSACRACIQPALRSCRDVGQGRLRARRPHPLRRSGRGARRSCSCTTGSRATRRSSRRSSILAAATFRVIAPDLPGLRREREARSAALRVRLGRLRGLDLRSRRGARPRPRPRLRSRDGRRRRPRARGAAPCARAQARPASTRSSTRPTSTSSSAPAACPVVGGAALAAADGPRALPRRTSRVRSTPAARTSPRAASTPSSRRSTPRPRVRPRTPRSSQRPTPGRSWLACRGSPPSRSSSGAATTAWPPSSTGAASRAP